MIKVIPAPQSVSMSGGTCDLTRLGGLGSLRQKTRNSLGEEEYMLEITPSKVTATASTDAGLFYATQTLRQMCASYGENALPCCVIKDAPRYPWRGFMLDESRHFFGTAYVRKTLEQMAWFKLNKFHWHLTDEPAWRMEIDAFPKLTRIGAEGNHTDHDAAPHYYTKDQIREIIAYAESLHIEVIPEIDMPGHASASNKAYPEHSGGEHPKYKAFTFNVGKEETYRYLETILKEVAELFPSRYLHIGGDEVSFGNSVWNTNPDIQELIRREKLDGLKGAEGWFVRRMVSFVRGLGKEPVLWDDVLDAGVGNEATIHWWRHDNQGHLHKALKGGCKTILCPRLPMYFDYVQAGNHVEGPKRNGCWNPQEDLYRFPDMQNESGDPHTKTAWNLTKEEEANVIGIQANLWTERIEDTSRADFMTWPRLCALSEAAWTKKPVKDYADFNVRMEDAFRYLDSRSVYYYDYRNPSRTPEPPVPAMFRK